MLGFRLVMISCSLGSIGALGHFRRALSLGHAPSALTSRISTFGNLVRIPRSSEIVCSRNRIVRRRTCGKDGNISLVDRSHLSSFRS
ncbi:hypothetical protein C8F01DRAFT_1098000 [Mycena amicta]|nr:hypothetical protein C8F01DRAFT_1098000 [Mycena amicta]